MTDTTRESGNDIYDAYLRSLENKRMWKSRAEAAEAERDEALNQLDSARYEVDCIKRRCEEWSADYDRAADNYAERISALAAKLALAVEALDKLHHAVCGETGFSECVRRDSGKVYPWPALDIADSLAQTTLAQLTADTPKEGKDDE